MSSKVLNCARDARTDRWKNYTNLKNLRYIRKDIRNGDFVLARLRSVNPQVTFTPILKVQGFEKGFQDRIFVPYKIWEKLGGRGARVELKGPKTRLARFRAWLLRLRYDKRLGVAVLGFLSALIWIVILVVPISPPWNYAFAVFLLVLWLAEIYSVLKKNSTSLCFDRWSRSSEHLCARSSGKHYFMLPVFDRR